MVSDKLVIGVVGIVAVTVLQLFAWYTGHDGVVFATTSLILGAIIGSWFDLKGYISNKIKAE